MLVSECLQNTNQVLYKSEHNTFKGVVCREELFKIKRNQVRINVKVKAQRNINFGSHGWSFFFGGEPGLNLLSSVSDMESLSAHTPIVVRSTRLKIVWTL